MGARIRRGLAGGVVVAFALVLALATLVPLYSDEITSWHQLTHALREGGGQGSLMGPLCRGTFSRPLYATTIPAAVLYRVLLGGVGLFGLRVSSLIVVAGWFIAVWRATRGRGFASFVALHAFGTFPLALVTARAEPVMLVALGVFAGLPLGFRQARSWKARAALGAVFLLTTSVFYLTHQRALFYTPLVLLSAALTFGWRRGRRLATPIVGALVLFTAVQAFQAARESSLCPNAPQTEARIRGVSLNPAAALADPLAAPKNLAGFADVTSAMMLLEPEQARPGFGWLPADAASWLPAAALPAADRLNRVANIALLVALPIFIVLAALRARRRPRVRRRAALAIAILLGVIASVAVTNIVAFYNLAGALPPLALAALLLAPALDAMHRAVVTLGAFVLQLAALMSLAVLFLAYAPKLLAFEGRPTTIFADRPATIPALDAARERAKIRAHARTCGIDGDHARRLVIDDATMFAFDDLREPIHVIYITDAAMWGDDFPGDKDVALLERLQASGLVTRCMFLPTKLVPKVQRDGDYCCVPAADLRSR